MKRLGRFTKAEILEAEERFNLGQSLYKIGRDMKRSQASIRGHLINLGLMEYEPEPVYAFKNESYSFSLMPNSLQCFILSTVMIISPSLGLVYIGLMFLKD